MSNETLVIGALLGVIAALVLLLRARASDQNANTDEHRLIVQLAATSISTTARITALEKDYEAAQDRETSYKAQVIALLDQVDSVTKLLTAANEKIDAQAVLLDKAYNEITRLNEQLGTLLAQKVSDAESKPDASPEIDSST